MKKGDKVIRELYGPGELVTQESADVLKITREGVWLDGGPGVDPIGPFEADTGWAKKPGRYTRQRIILLHSRKKK